jgi:acyl-CoA synthetase (AMP-forming)/AMP-acid ligase II
MNWLVERLESYGDKSAIISGFDSYSYSYLLKEFEQMKNDNSDIFPRNSIQIMPHILYALKYDKVVSPINPTTIWDEPDLSPHATMCNFIYPSPGITIDTSGTTGGRKTAFHNLNKFMEKYKKERIPYRTILNMNWNSMGGIDILLTTLSSGGTLIIPETRNVGNILGLIELYKIELLPATPSFLNLMLHYPFKEYGLSSLKIIAYGAEPMPLLLLDKLHEFFPDVKLKQTFGMTELGTLRTQSRPDNTYIKIDADYKVIDNVLYIKSPTSMLGYLNHPSPFTEDGYLNTGDIVIDTLNGWIMILGRQSNIINVGGNKVYPEFIENILLSCEYVNDCLVYGEKNDFVGEIVVADVACDYSNYYKIKEYIERNLEKYQRPIKINWLDHIEYTESGKKRRNK